MRTNRDFYRFVTAIRGRPAPGLEQYLLALWRLATERRTQAALSLGDVTAMLEQALTAEPRPFDPSWMATDDAVAALPGYPRFAQVIRAQIVDLHAMAEDGTLADEQRYFGVEAPRRPRKLATPSRWYNFTPRAFLECGAQGAFGGWRDDLDDDEDTGDRIAVGGPAIAPVDERIRLLDPFSWEDFVDLLLNGQTYE